MYVLEKDYLYDLPQQSIIWNTWMATGRRVVQRESMPHYENARAAVQAPIRPATRDNLKSKSDEILFSINRDSRNKRCGSSSEQ